MNDSSTWCLITLLLASLTAGTVYLSGEFDGSPPEGGASFQGRSVQAWLDDLRAPDRETRAQAYEAFGDMEPANQDAVPELVQALSDEDQLVRAAAARALGRIGPPARDALPALEAAGSEARGQDLREILQARGRIEGRKPSGNAPPAQVEEP